MPAANLEPTTLPRVQGRHKTHVLAARRRIRAVELASRGLTYQAIAEDELGYANRGTVHRIVSQALQTQQVATVEEHRSLEKARLDALQASLAPRVAQGDLAAMKMALGVVMARCRLLGLLDHGPAVRPPLGSSNCGPETVIVHVDDCRHKGCWWHGKFEAGTLRLSSAF